MLSTLLRLYNLPRWLLDLFRYRHLKGMSSFQEKP